MREDVTKGNVVHMPILKLGSTAAEKFYELAHEAEDHPENFKFFILNMFKEDGESDYAIHGGMKMYEALGLIEIFKADILAGWEECES